MIPLECIHTMKQILSDCSVQTDAWFEVVSVVMNMAIWHTKHAALKASDDRYIDTLLVFGIVKATMMQYNSGRGEGSSSFAKTCCRDVPAH